MRRQSPPLLRDKLVFGGRQRVSSGIKHISEYVQLTRLLNGRDKDVGAQDHQYFCSRTRFACVICTAVFSLHKTAAWHIYTHTFKSLLK